MADIVTIERRGRLAGIRIARPQKMNTLDVALAQTLPAALEEVARDESVRAVVLSGEGRSFMAGGDLSVFQADLDQAPETARLLLAGFHRALRSIAAMDKPVIAAVQGPVAGAGVGLAFACDLVIAAEGTSFLSAYARLGASPDDGTSWTLSRLIGPKRALAFILLNEPMSAEEARQLGLVHRVVPASDLGNAADDLAQRFAESAVGSTTAVKRLVSLAARGSFEEQLAAEGEAFARAAQTADFREGVAAFFERRPARFAD